MMKASFTKAPVMSLLTIFVLLQTAQAACWKKEEFKGEKWEMDLIQESKLPETICFEAGKVTLNKKALEKSYVVSGKTNYQVNPSFFNTSVNDEHGIHFSVSLVDHLVELATCGESKRVIAKIYLVADKKGAFMRAPQLAVHVGKTLDNCHSDFDYTAINYRQIRW
jgi:hypothetical protein